MADEKFTRCPGCKTVFRVTPQQLSMRAGQVRCGHCRTVFDGVRALVSLAPHAHEEPELDEIAMGPPTVTLRSAQALQTAPREDHDAEERDEREDEQAEASADPQLDYSSRFAWQEQKERRRVPTWLVGLSIPILLVLLAAQALFHFRDAIAAHWPATKPTLVRLCQVASCEVQPLTDIAALSIEASDLQADPAHRGLLVLSTTIRNRAAYAQAYPYVELTLSDAQEQVVVRRAFAPQEYLSAAAADPRSGIGGNGELAIKLFIDASATTQAGYQVYLFYP
ncbi:MAG TPA: zinc-ribbon and DUF3426 domain-containing protein [Casimicrobiaceae bacterium]|jgi:predicted Zn finger-like uncharacterized protein